MIEILTHPLFSAIVSCLFTIAISISVFLLWVVAGKARNRFDKQSDEITKLRKALIREQVERKKQEFQTAAEIRRLQTKDPF